MALHVREATDRKPQVMKKNEIPKEKRVEVELLHITELSSYLEGKPNINKTENFQRNQSQFFHRGQKQPSTNLQAFPRCVPEIAVSLRRWMEIKSGKLVPVPHTWESCLCPGETEQE